MGKSGILKRALVGLGVCLTLAWAGALYAAEGQTPSSAATSSDGEDLLLIKSDNQGVIVELRTPSFQIEESSVGGTAYHTVIAPECGQTDDVGQPQLPARGTLLGIPPEAEYSLRVLEVEQETVPGQYNINAVPQPVAERDAEGNPVDIAYVPARDESVYSSNAFYPASVSEVGSSGFVRDQRVLQLRFFPFQYNPVSGELRHYTRVRVEVRFSHLGGQPLLSAASTGDESFDGVLENGLLNYDSARQWRAQSSSREAESALVLGQGEPGYKVLVDEDGIYQLTYTALVNAGMDLGSVHPDDFELYNRDQEVAIRVVDEDDDGDFDEEDYILFYGQQMTTTNTYTNVYWLGTGTGDGLRMPEKDGTLGASTVLTYFTTTTHWEQDLGYYSLMPEPADIPSDEETDHWFAGVAVVPGASTKNFVVPVDSLAVSPPYTATLRGGLNGKDWGEEEYDHHAEVYLNNQLVHDGLWSGQGKYEFESGISNTLLADGNNTVKLKAFLTDPEAADYDRVYMNWVEIDYRRTYTAENDLLFFDGDEEGTWQYELPGFLTGTVELFDVTDTFSATHFVSSTVEASGTYTLKFQDSISGEHHYLALAPSQYSTPVVVEDDPSNLKSTSNEADYIIITYPDFEDAVLPLADHRAGQGLRVEVVDVQDIYDEFSYGIFNPRAIRDFLKYAFDNWVSPPPSYVLLVGDGNYDFKNHAGTGEPNYIPPYLIYADEWIGETVADNRFVCVSGDDELPDMYIGRLPAQTSTQVTTMVSKTIDYEANLPAGDWRLEVFFLADDPDNPEDPNTPNHFWSLSDDIADSHLPPAPLYVAEKVYYGIAPYTAVDSVRNALRDAFENGRLFINYVGHGAAGQWGGGYPDEPFLLRSEVAALPSSDKTPVVMAMACNEGYFIHSNSAGSETYSCVAESMVRVEGKGSVANWSPTSFGTSSDQHYLHVGFYNAVFRGSVYTLGPATYLGKMNLYANTSPEHWRLLDTYVVLGDPALEMPIEQTYWAFVPLSLKRY
jgi:hypothetical protein